MERFSWSKQINPNNKIAICYYLRNLNISKRKQGKQKKKFIKLMNKTYNWYEGKCFIQDL